MCGDTWGKRTIFLFRVIVRDGTVVNPKHEIRNPKQTLNSKSRKFQTRTATPRVKAQDVAVWSLGFSALWSVGDCAWA